MRYVILPPRVGNNAAEDGTAVCPLQLCRLNCSESPGRIDEPPDDFQVDQPGHTKHNGDLRGRPLGADMAEDLHGLQVQRGQKRRVGHQNGEEREQNDQTKYQKITEIK